MPPVQQQGVTILGPANINRGVVLCKQSTLGKYKPLALEPRCCFYIRQSDKLPLVLLKGTISSVILLFSTCQNFNLHYKFSMFNAAYIIPSKAIPLVSSWVDVTGRTATGHNIVIRCTDQAAADKQHTELTSATPRTKMFIGPITKIFLLIKRIYFPEYLGRQQ